jgi:hypothetical protein
MSVVWAVLLAIPFLRMGKSVAAVIGVAVFSHFVLDILMHPPDLALWPGSSVHLGLGLWRSLPNGWWAVELAVIAAGWGYYAWKSRGSSTFGGHPIGVGIALLIFHVFNAPWLSAF